MSSFAGAHGTAVSGVLGGTRFGVFSGATLTLHGVKVDNGDDSGMHFKLAPRMLDRIRDLVRLPR